MTVDAPTELLLAGEWRASSDGQRFDVIDPANESVLGQVASATSDDARASVVAAAAAQRDWAQAAPRLRAEVLRKCFELVQAREADFARLIVAENGKPLADAKAEITYAAEFLRWYSEEAVRLEGTLNTAPSGGYKLMVLRQPIGVALLITPWNLPLAMITRKVAPALAAGCGVVIKPASATPLTALAFGAILDEAEVPPGLVNILPTRSTGEVVDTILGAEPVRKLSFTGSTEVGRSLLAKASARVISCSMELGGNAPLILLEDADLDVALQAVVVAKMRHNAEACTAANRLYVHESIEEEFNDRLAEALGNLQIGPGNEAGVEVGPLIDSDARSRVHALVEEAVAGGAKALAGGSPLQTPGFFYPPTVLAGVDNQARILTEEVFGPVAPVVPFDDEQAVLDWANATNMGLMSYVFSRDVGRALAFAERLESGMVAINRAVISDPAAPFGGMKESGIGREGGHEGMLEYTESKYIGVEW